HVSDIFSHWQRVSKGNNQSQQRENSFYRWLTIQWTGWTIDCRGYTQILKTRLQSEAKCVGDIRCNDGNFPRRHIFLLNQFADFLQTCVDHFGLVVDGYPVPCLRAT